MSRPLIIVGAGLFGSIAAALVRRRDPRREIIVVDAGLERAGSRPAACLIRPSWISGLGPVAESGMAVLRELYVVHDLTFRLKPIGTAAVQWVDPQDIWAHRNRCSRFVRGIASISGDGEVTVRHGIGKNMDILRGDVLVAGGVWSFMQLWTADLNFPKFPTMKALAGAAFTFRGELPRPLISVWAPYKQTVAFTREPGTTWVGDGSSIIERNWTDEREGESLRRCQRAVGRRPLLRAEVGLRPYVEGHKAGYFAKVGKRTWVSTGGAKNGTVIAAHQARLIMEQL